MSMQRVAPLVSKSIDNYLTNRKTWGGVIYNVMSYGAKGNGISNDTADIQSTINAAKENGGGIVRFPPGRYRCTSTITVPSNVILEGSGMGISTIDFSDMAAGTTLTDAKGIHLLGSLGIAITVTVAVSESSNQITVSDASSLAAEDIILLTNSELYDPLTTVSSWTKSEMLRIKSIASNVITTYDETIFAYALTNCQVQKITPTENVAIRDISVQMGGVGSAHNGIYIDMAYNVSVDNVHVVAAEAVGVGFNTTYYGSMSDCLVEDSTSPGGSIGNTGYGALAHYSARHITIMDNKFKRCRHAVAGGDMACDIIVSGNQSTGCTNLAYDCHEPCFYWTFEGNHSFSDAGGFNVRGQHVAVIGNRITNPSQVGIYVSSFQPVTSQNGIKIIGNTLDNCVSNAIQANGANGKIKEIQVLDNMVTDAVFIGIIVQNFDGAQVSDNTVKMITGTNSDGISILGSSTSDTSSDIIVSDNRVETVNRYGIRIEYVDEVTVSNPVTRECGNAGIRILDCTAVTITGGMSVNTVFNSIIAQNTEEIIIQGFKGYTNSNAAGVGIRIAACNDVTIAHCIIKGNQSNAIYITTTDNVIVNNNNVRDNTATTKINIDSSAVTKFISDNIGAFSGTATIDPASMVDGAGVTVTIPVTGAALGDIAEFSAPYSLQGITATAFVSAANTVSVRLQNETGSTIDLASGTWKAQVKKI